MANAEKVIFANLFSYVWLYISTYVIYFNNGIEEHTLQTNISEDSIFAANI